MHSKSFYRIGYFSNIFNSSKFQKTFVKDESCSSLHPSAALEVFPEKYSFQIKYFTDFLDVKIKILSTESQQSLMNKTTWNSSSDVKKMEANKIPLLQFEAWMDPQWNIWNLNIWNAESNELKMWNVQFILKIFWENYLRKQYIRSELSEQILASDVCCRYKSEILFLPNHLLHLLHLSPWMLLEAPACEGTSLIQSEEPGDGRVKYVIIKEVDDVNQTGREEDNKL